MLAGIYASPTDSIDAELVAALVQGLHSCLDSTALCQRLVAIKNGMSAVVFCVAMLEIGASLPDQLTACACLARLYETARLLNEVCRKKLEDAVLPGGVFKWIPHLLKYAIEVHHSVKFVVEKLFMSLVDTAVHLAMFPHAQRCDNTVWSGCCGGQASDVSAALQEPCPWSVDLGVAVTRMLFRCQHEAIIQVIASCSMLYLFPYFFTTFTHYVFNVWIHKL